MRIKQIIPLIAVVAFASSATAQESDGWDVEVDLERKLTVAAVRYDTGQGLIVQCRDGELSTVLTGLPPPATPLTPINGVYSRRLETGAADALRPSPWRTTLDGASAMRPGDARGVRSLKTIGRLVVRTTPTASDPARRLALDLPTDSAGLDQVLGACDRPLIDPRDALPDVSHIVKIDGDHRGLTPGNLTTVGSYGFEYSCIIAPDRRVRDCVIESERPKGRGLGERLLRSAPRARFNFGDDPESLVGAIFYIDLGLDITRTTVVS